MQTLLTAVGVGLIAASIVILSTEDRSQIMRAGLCAVFGLMSLLVGLTLRRSHRHRHRRY